MPNRRLLIALFVTLAVSPSFAVAESAAAARARGTALYRKGRFAEACPLLVEAATKLRKDAGAYNDAGLCLVKLSSPDQSGTEEATRLLDTAVRLGDAKQRRAAYLILSLAMGARDFNPCNTLSRDGVGTACTSVADDAGLAKSPANAATLGCCELRGDDFAKKLSGWTSREALVWVERCDASCQERWHDPHEDDATFAPPAADAAARPPTAVLARVVFETEVRHSYLPGDNSDPDYHVDPEPAEEPCLVVSVDAAHGRAGAVCHGKVIEIPILPGRRWSLPGRLWLSFPQVQMQIVAADSPHDAGLISIRQPEGSVVLSSISSDPRAEWRIELKWRQVGQGLTIEVRSPTLVSVDSAAWPGGPIPISEQTELRLRDPKLGETVIRAGYRPE